MLTEHDLELRSIRYRRKLLQIIKAAGAGHTGGDLSCIDILNVLYNRVLNVSPETFASPDRDRYIQSKGHCAEALYVVLADNGFFPEDDLATLAQYQSKFTGHPTRKVPGVEHNTGALGHGLAVAVGIAIAGKLHDEPYGVFTLLGDGELNEGSSWEASLLAAHRGLDNLVVIVDRNGLQITGRTEDVLAIEPLADKLAAFGYSVRIVDGHDIAQLLEAFDAVPFEPGKPSLILAETVKGKGVSFIENVTSWHHHVPSDEEYQVAMRELGQAEQRLLNGGVGDV